MRKFRREIMQKHQNEAYGAVALFHFATAPIWREQTVSRVLYEQRPFEHARGSHLSWRGVAAALQPPPWGRPGRPVCPQYRGVAADRVYMNGHSRAVPWALTPRFHPCRPVGRRYLSVALFLKSPSAAVSRYPCPAQPGLSSPARFRAAGATALFTHGGILLSRSGPVKEGLHLTCR